METSRAAVGSCLEKWLKSFFFILYTFFLPSPILYIEFVKRAIMLFWLISGSRPDAALVDTPRFPMFEWANGLNVQSSLKWVMPVFTK